jgi:hypothetical protein
MKLLPSLAGACALVALAIHPARTLAQAREALPADVAEAGGEQEGPSQLSITEETFSLPIAEANHLLHNVPSDALRYARLRDLLAGGKARLERLIVLRTKSGQRAMTESFNELHYGTEFRPPEAPQSPSDGKVVPAPEKPTPENLWKNGGNPIAFDTRNVGDSLEVEPVVGPDGITIDLNLVPQSVRYAGERVEGSPHPVKTPIFEVSKLTTSVTVRDGQPFFLGTLNPPFGNGLAREQKEQRVWLDFVTVNVVRLPPAGAKSRGAAATLAKAQAMRLAKLEFREASLAEAVEFLRKKSVELDPEKKGLNIVLKAPPNLVQTKITLSLRDVSLYDAARYVANLGALIVEPEESALLLRVAGEDP